jgi:hypothetical protein
MKRVFFQLIIGIRRTLWAIIVAYMLGIHNFYRGEDKAPDNIVVVEPREEQGDAAPRD